MQRFQAWKKGIGSRELAASFYPDFKIAGGRDEGELGSRLADFRHAALGFGFFEAPNDSKYRACNGGLRKALCSVDPPP